MRAQHHVGAAAPGPVTPATCDDARELAGCAGTKDNEKAEKGDCAGPEDVDQASFAVESTSSDKVIALLQIRDQHAGNDSTTQAGQRRSAERACTCHTAPRAQCMACGYFNRIQRDIGQRACASWGGSPQ